MEETTLLFVYLTEEPQGVYIGTRGKRTGGQLLAQSTGATAPVRPRVFVALLEPRAWHFLPVL